MCDYSPTNWMVFVGFLHHMRMAGYYGLMLVSTCPSVYLSFVRPSVFSFLDYNLSKCQWIFNFVCALILWSSGLGLLMGKFCQFSTQLSPGDMSLSLFLDDNLSNYQWIFTTLSMYIDIFEIWFGIANGQISWVFYNLPTA